MLTCVVAVLVVVGILYARTRTAAATPHNWAKAKATPATVACHTANSKISISKATRDNIEMSTFFYLSDVPAGTNVDVKLASYSPTTVTGTDYYPAKYGSYNFAMAKQSDGWHITDFKHCY